MPDSTQGLGVRGSGSESKKTLASPLPGRIKSRSVPVSGSAQGLGAPVHYASCISALVFGGFRRGRSVDRSARSTPLRG